MILFDTLPYMEDPARDLACLRRLLKPQAQVLVGQQTVESTPGILAINAAFGAKQVLSWKGVELLSSTGYGLSRRYEILATLRRPLGRHSIDTATHVGAFKAPDIR